MISGADAQTAIASIMRVAALVIMTISVLPRVYRESQVPNGIGLLRRLILFAISIFYSTNLVVTIINIMRIFDVVDESVIGGVALLNGVGELLLVSALYVIYKLDYGREKK